MTHDRSIPFNDLKRGPAVVRAAMADALRRVLDSGWYVLGGECAAFESEFAAFCGTAYCIGVANGTDAIELGLRAIGVEAGHRVANVANAGFYATTALLAIGAEPVFVDVERRTSLMDVDHLERLLADRAIDAVVVTHLYGRCHGDMPRICDLAGRFRVPVFEDCAQAHGAALGSRKAGSFGQAAAFSFYPTKNLGAAGDGGAVVTSDDEVAARLRRSRQYGWKTKYRSVAPGRNSRLDEMQAAILRSRLPHLEADNARRRAIAHRYATELRHRAVTLPAEGSDESFVAHLFVVLAAGRDDLRRHLTENGVSTEIHYPVPDHRQAPIAARHREVNLPVTLALADEVLSLPCFPELSDDEVGIVIRALNAW